MLRVRTYLDRSSVDGIGLFAAEDIAAGRVVWEFSPHVDLVYSARKWKNICCSCSEESLSQIRKYAYKEGGKYYVCTDNAQFMNHSHESPNVVNGANSRINVAARDIRKGEELLCNYLEYSDHDDPHLRNIAR